MTGPIDQRVAVIEAMTKARKILGERDLMSSFELAQLDRGALALNDLRRGRPAQQTRRGRPERDSEEVLLVAAARALCAIYAENFKAASSFGDVADILHFGGYTLSDGSWISAETVRGWMNVKNPRVLALTELVLALENESPGKQARGILRFIGPRVTRAGRLYSKRSR